MIRGARAAKGAPPWQDIRSVYPPTAVCGAFRIHGAHILPKPAHFGCMARESCRELAIFPSEAAFGMRGAQNLPRIDPRERTAAESCHGKTPENASRQHLATAASFKNASRRHIAKKALDCPGLLRNRSGAAESEDAARTKRRPIQQRAPTRPRNHENILVPFTKKQHQKRTRVVWRT